MARTKTLRLSCDRADTSTDIASSYVQGERIKKMLKAISYENKKNELVVNLDKKTISLELACYQVDLLSRANTTKAYELVSKEGISKLNFNKIK